MKRTFAIISAACMIFAASACGDKKSSSEKQKTSPVFEATVFGEKISLPCTMNDMKAFSLDPNVQFYFGEADVPFTESYWWYGGYNVCRLGMIDLEGDYDETPDESKVVYLDFETAPLNHSGEEFSFDYMGLGKDSHAEDVYSLLGEPDEDWGKKCRYYVGDANDSFVEFKFASDSRIEKITLAYKKPEHPSLDSWD